MTHNEYDICLYHPKFKSEVVDVLKYLWGFDLAGNAAYFTWKYDENPFTERPLGIVARHNGQVIGFRGLFASKWEIPSKDLQFTILCPSDTVVHPEHRRKGLSVKMGRKAMRELSPQYKVFLNLSTTKPSVLGYIKLGFSPLAKKRRISSYNLLGLARFLYFRKNRSEYSSRRIKLGRFDNIEVAATPLPEEMERIILGQKKDQDKFKLIQNAAYYRWRFDHRRYKYLFYYSREDEAVNGFVVLRLTENKRRANIIDFSESNSQVFEQILSFIIEKNHFDLVSILKYSTNTNTLLVLRNLGFKEKCLLQRLERRVLGELPLLIRPVTLETEEKDWIYEGLDIRQMENWEIKEICSDGV